MGGDYFQSETGKVSGNHGRGRGRNCHLQESGRGDGCCGVATPLQAPVWGFRGERPILRTAVRAQGPWPRTPGHERRDHTVGLGQVMGGGGKGGRRGESGFCFKRRATESCSEEYGSISKHLSNVHLSDVQPERKH